jgi:tetratricopeptide (TPR) repeat protein
MTRSRPVETFVVPPDPGDAGTLGEIIDRLRSLKIWAGNPSYEVITNRVNAVWAAGGRPASELARRATVADCFKKGRRRINADLVIAIVEALHPDAGYVAQWRQALRVIGGETTAAAQVRTQDTLPADLAEFTGRGTELDRLRYLLRRGAANGGAVVISAIEGMAGVGKTQLAIHAGHLLHTERPFERVLFVNLRGFHPNPAQPPADPAAVLDSFLRLLGVPGQQIPQDTDARTALYRQRLAGTHALIILDNAATEAQVQPLLPAGPGCLTLVTSRRHLTDLPHATHLPVDVFTPNEALDFLKRALPDTPPGDDPDALARITHRCGNLPLALGLIAGHIRTKVGWTLTDHADRLDDRHRDRHLDTGVELALDLSYQHLPTERQRLFRLLALHPGPDLDTYAAANLAATDLETARGHLHYLCAEHLLRPTAPGRYTFHDLVRDYAAARAIDDERPPQRQAARNRLLTYYLHTATTAATHHQPDFTPPTTTQTVDPPTAAPTFTDPQQATDWLTTEQPNLAAATTHAATHHHTCAAIGIPAALHEHLRTRGPWHLAVRLHHTALTTAQHSGDQPAQAHTLNNLAYMQYLTSDFPAAAATAEQAHTLYQQLGDRRRQATALNTLALVQYMTCDDPAAAATAEQAHTLYQQLGDRHGQATALDTLARVQHITCDYQAAAATAEQAHTLFQQLGDRRGQAGALDTLARVQQATGDYPAAAATAAQAHTLHQQTGNRHGQAYALGILARVQHSTGDDPAAAATAAQAHTLYQQIGDRHGQANALSILALVQYATGDYPAAVAAAAQAHTLYQQLGDRHGQANAVQVLGIVQHATGDHPAATITLDQALNLFRDVGDPDGEAETLNHIGQLLLDSNEPTPARQHFTTALAIAHRIDTPTHQARALEGLAHCTLHEGHHTKAITHLHEALTIYQHINSPHATRVQAALHREQR